MSGGVLRHQGLRLGLDPRDPRWYSVRWDGKDWWWRGAVLPREWLVVYVRWHRERGERKSAARLLRSWLAEGGDRWARCAGGPR